MSEHKFVTPYYEPINGKPPTDPEAPFYPDNYDVNKVNVTPNSYYVIVTGSKYEHDEELDLTTYIEFMDNPTESLITEVTENGYTKHTIVFDSIIWKDMLNFVYLKYPLSPVMFVSEFDVLIVHYWLKMFYSKYRPNDDYGWMQAAVDTVRYFGSQRCINATNFYSEFLGNTIHKEAITNIKKFAKLGGYDRVDMPTLVYSLYNIEPFGGLRYAQPII